MTLAVGYHWTPAHLESDELQPSATSGNSYWSYEGDRVWRSGRVWMFDTAAAAFNFGGLPGVVYQVAPAPDVARLAGDLLDDGPDGFDEGMAAQYHASSATILAEVHHPLLRVVR